MDSNFDIYLKRAKNDLELALMIIQISDDKNMQISVFKLEGSTYYSAAISHAYYSIFYSAKAYLMIKNIKTSAPEEHRKTFEEFKKLVDKGIVDVELLKIYEKILVRADTLLNIFEIEKGKRGKFTYHKLSQANKEPAEESVENANMFFKHIHRLCWKK